MTPPSTTTKNKIKTKKSQRKKEIVNTKLRSRENRTGRVV
jgi:hypothetical protein